MDCQIRQGTLPWTRGMYQAFLASNPRTQMGATGRLEWVRPGINSVALALTGVVVRVGSALVS